MIGVTLLTTPFTASAFPFGGQASQVINCYNQAIYANLGPPIGGPYIWTPSTKTYSFGPPSRAGQWLLGLASAPYYCIVSIIPLTIYSGTAISMMGSSGPSAPGSTYVQDGTAGFTAKPTPADYPALLNATPTPNTTPI